jgi:hypothetical protein
MYTTYTGILSGLLSIALIASIAESVYVPAIQVYTASIA